MARGTAEAQSQLSEFDDSSVEPGVWRYARARRVRVAVDGEEYFDLVQQAMLRARQRILLIGWDFDTRIHLTRGRRWYQRPFDGSYPSRLGSFILWLNRTKPGLEVRILKWSYSVFSLMMRGTMLFDLIRWARHRRIDFKFDTAHPLGCSHHQKIVVIDKQFAVCGGIDMTGGRWDTRAHHTDDPGRKLPRGTHYGPWHDVTMMMEGEVAGALEDLGRQRWIAAGGKPLKPSEKCEESAWPEGLDAHFEEVEIGIARTRAEHGDLPKIDEIETLFCKQILGARRFIYAENQYFASRAVCEAIAQRLAQPDPPEIVIVHPNSAQGWAEEQAMNPARAELVSALAELDQNHCFHLYVPYTDDRPIYVHAKLLIIDDEVLRIGSANFNNRSMGLDSECDVFIDARRPGNDHAREPIARIRHSLLAEHCGIDEEAVPGLLATYGSMAAMIAGVNSRGEGLQRRHLRPFHPEPMDETSRELALRETLDPEEPGDVFAILPAKNGLFRPGSLLAKARARARARLRRIRQVD
ncbi:phospholipase D-like domain-containing protein [Aurantiacibacter xanthus]|nr:phospholipase D-like domain-containing protein [Aurantiacibacter xanthus]